MPDSADPVTLGEVYRRLTQFESRIDANVQSINTQIATTARDFIHIDRYLAERAATGERIAGVESDIAEIRADNKWLRRTVILAVGGAVLNIVVGTLVLLIGIGFGG